MALRRIGRLAARALAAALLLHTASSHASLIPAAWASVGVGGVNGGSSAFNGGPGYHSASMERSSPLGNYGAASSSLSDGSLKALSFSVVQTEKCKKFWVGCVDSYASAQADIRDSITFRAKDLKNPGEIKFRFEITGSENTPGPVRKYWPYSRAMFSFGFGNSSANVNTWRQVHQGDIFAGSLAFPTGVETMTLDFWASIATEAYSGGWSDYSHTARFFWELPPGVEYSSASGTFMADHRQPPAAEVPEPASLALTGVGLFALGFSKRRRSNRRG